MSFGKSILFLLLKAQSSPCGNSHKVVTAMKNYKGIGPASALLGLDIKCMDKGHTWSQFQIHGAMPGQGAVRQENISSFYSEQRGLVPHNIDCHENYPVSRNFSFKSSEWKKIVKQVYYLVCVSKCLWAKNLFLKGYITSNINYLEAFKKHFMCWNTTQFP